MVLLEHQAFKVHKVPVEQVVFKVLKAVPVQTVQVAHQAFRVHKVLQAQVE